MKLKNSVKIMLTVTILLLSIFAIYKKIPQNIFKKSEYNDEAISVMQELNIYNVIHDNDYSKVVEEMLVNHKYNNNHLNAYLKINWVDKNDFLNIVNTLLDSGYSAQEINLIIDNLSDVNINKLLTLAYQNLEGYYKIKNLNVDNIKKYNDYKNLKEINLEDAVTQVNIGLDHNYYTEIKEVENPDDLLVLVNKYNALPANYEPDDLVSLSNGSQFKLRKVAAEAYEKLIGYAEQNGVEVLPFSGYRSYNTQKAIYNNHVNNNGREKADTYSARPGHSEHQLGLAVDIRSKDYELKRLTKEDAKWINENCSKFGFIVRYTKEDEFITGYMEETWHLRYVGVKVAKEVMSLGITYDEYYDLYIKEY